MTTIVQEAHLQFQSGNSDKVYHATLEQVGDDQFVVKTAWGRRGSTLSTGTKTPGGPVSRAAAQKAFDKVVKEKLKEDYKPMRNGNGASEGTGYVAAAQPEDTGLRPQLLNEITEAEAEPYIEDGAWVAQEKLDGRRMLVAVEGGEATGANRRGHRCSLPAVIARELACRCGTLGRVVIDGEAVGETLWAFDLLDYDGQDWRGQAYLARYNQLSAFLAGLESVRIVPVAVGADNKRSVVAQLKALRAEGVVFKQLHAPHSAGKPNAGGTQVKLKFWSQADVVIAAGRDGKRSVGMVVHDEAGLTVNVGNVTVPVNYPIPRPGAVATVRYLYYFPGGALFQPQYEGERDDKAPAECTLAQLKLKAGGAEAEADANA